MKNILKRGLVAVLILFAIFSIGCSKQNIVVPEKTDTITINNFVFEPANIEINAGSTVIWFHNTSVTHILVSQSLFESNELNRGDNFTFTFPNSGEYNYYCSIHPSMKGRIIVK